MKYEEACEILDINPDECLDINAIKRKYRIKALMYHPDKNKDATSNAKFIEVNEAYEYLMEYETFVNNKYDINNIDNRTPFRNNHTYSEMMQTFLQTLFTGDINTAIFQTILKNVSNMCENKSLELLENVEKSTLIKTYDILSKYQHVFHISNEFLTSISTILKNKTSHDECIILNPLLSDLYENNVYKLVVNNQTYIVPLWHHELVYDNAGNEIIVKCFPIMPENMSIDSNNNIHIHVQQSIQECLQQETIHVVCNQHVLPISTNTLKITKTQTIVFAKRGISKINTNNIYDISNISDVFITIELY